MQMVFSPLLCDAMPLASAAATSEDPTSLKGQSKLQFQVRFPLLLISLPDIHAQGPSAVVGVQAEVL